ncbi:MAG: type II toxin-antitoxin system RelE/ParE family toxin [Myxococcota bacterium]
MMVLFREVAEADLDEAIAYYEAIDPDLALRFQDELALAIQRIDDQPEAHLAVHADVRRARLNRFPHTVCYRVVDQNTVVIVACIHPSRDPTIWMGRR